MAFGSPRMVHRREDASKSAIPTHASRERSQDRGQRATGPGAAMGARQSSMNTPHAGPVAASLTSSSERWRPSVTVAAVIEHDGRYLLVEERTADGVRLNNPAGHLDPGESPLQAVMREALEETARQFTPLSVLGIYFSRFQRARSREDVTYLRIAFSGTVGEAAPDRALDEPIIRTLWMTPAEVRASAARHRSPLLLRCVEDHLAGKRYPLELLHADASLWQPEQRP